MQERMTITSEAISLGLIKPGDTISFTVTKRRRWWQFWKPPTTTETEKYTVIRKI